MDTPQGARSPSAVRAPLRGGTAWRHFGDFRNFLLVPQLLLLQVAHPVVGTGVEDHSDFRTRPWQRLWRTVASLHTVIYGGQAAATAEGERLLRVHIPMKGLAELRHPRKPPVRLLPGFLWRPVGARAAHYAMLVTVGTLPPVLRERLGLGWTPGDERSLRRLVRLVRFLMKLVPPPLRIAGALAIAYWNTHGPGTDPRTRRPLGAPG